MFDKAQLAKALQEQSKDVSVTGRFIQTMGFGQGKSHTELKAQYDSIVAGANSNTYDVNDVIPSALLDLEKAVQHMPKGMLQMLDSIDRGVTDHRNTHGGDYPSATLVAAALSSAALLQTALTQEQTGGLFDSATANTTQKGMFDSVSSGQSAHTAEVPSLAMVTIATTIASAAPIISYLPNPKGTQTVPLVYVRQVAATSYNQTKKGDFLDGVNAAASYFDSVHRFEMTSTDQLTFTVTAARSVLEGTNTPDTASGVLPLVAGATAITLGGVFLAQDEQSHVNSGSTTGEISILAGDRDGIEIDGEVYKFSSGTTNLDTGTVTITLDKALPATVKVFAQVVANYEAKDSQGNNILPVPSVDVKLEYSTVTAYSIRAIYVASIEALTQLQNELGVDMRAAFVAIVIGKLMYEQTIRLLRQAVQSAETNGSTRIFDISRGTDLASAFNKTSDLASELLPAIEDEKRRIVAKASHTPSGFDFYVSGSLATLVRSLADDTNFIPSGLTLGLPNATVRIGSRGSDHFYYVPEAAKILPNTVDGGTILMVARNEQAAKSVFIGHVAVPVVTDDVRANAFEKGVTYYTRQAAEMNKNKRFAGQVSVITVTNLPKSLVTG